MMINLHKGNGKPQEVNINKLCIDFIKSKVKVSSKDKKDITSKKIDQGSTINPAGIKPFDKQKPAAPSAVSKDKKDIPQAPQKGSVR